MKTEAYRWNSEARFVLLILILQVVFVLGCSGSAPNEEMVRNFAVDNAGLIIWPDTKISNYDVDFKITNKYTEKELDGSTMFVYVTEVTMKHKASGQIGGPQKRRTGFSKKGNEWFSYVLEP